MTRVLFDEDVPRPLRRDLEGFEIHTVVEAGWSGVQNGELLRRVEGRYDVLLTADRNLRFQQTIGKLQIGVVVLAAGSTKLRDLQPLVSDISEALRAVAPGQVLVVPQAPEPG